MTAKIIGNVTDTPTWKFTDTPTWKFNATGGCYLQIERLGSRASCLRIRSGDKDLAVIDMSTGKVTLDGDPDDAARIFWDAVARMITREIKS